MKKLICKVFGHSVETTHKLPTREICTRCGLSRSIKRIPETNCFQWIYSDGRKSIGLVAVKVNEIRFGDIQ